MEALIEISDSSDDDEINPRPSRDIYNGRSRERTAPLWDNNTVIHNNYAIGASSQATCVSSAVTKARSPVKASTPVLQASATSPMSTEARTHSQGTWQNIQNQLSQLISNQENDFSDEQAQEIIRLLQQLESHQLDPEILSSRQASTFLLSLLTDIYLRAGEHDILMFLQNALVSIDNSEQIASDRLLAAELDGLDSPGPVCNAAETSTTNDHSDEQRPCGSPQAHSILSRSEDDVDYTDREPTREVPPRRGPPTRTPDQTAISPSSSASSASGDAAVTFKGGRSVGGLKSATTTSNTASIEPDAAACDVASPTTQSSKSSPCSTVWGFHRLALEANIEQDASSSIEPPPFPNQDSGSRKAHDAACMTEQEVNATVVKDGHLGPESKEAAILEELAENQKDLAQAEKGLRRAENRIFGVSSIRFAKIKRRNELQQEMKRLNQAHQDLNSANETEERYVLSASLQRYRRRVKAEKALIAQDSEVIARHQKERDEASELLNVLTEERKDLQQDLRELRKGASLTHLDQERSIPPDHISIVGSASDPEDDDGVDARSEKSDGANSSVAGSLDSIPLSNPEQSVSNDDISNASGTYKEDNTDDEFHDCPVTSKNSNNEISKDGNSCPGLRDLNADSIERELERNERRRKQLLEMRSQLQTRSDSSPMPCKAIIDTDPSCRSKSAPLKRKQPSPSTPTASSSMISVEDAIEQDYDSDVSTPKRRRLTSNPVSASPDIHTSPTPDPYLATITDHTIRHQIAEMLDIVHDVDAQSCHEISLKHNHDFEAAVDHVLDIKDQYDAQVADMIGPPETAKASFRKFYVSLIDECLEGISQTDGSDDLAHRDNDEHGGDESDEDIVVRRRRRVPRLATEGCQSHPIRKAKEAKQSSLGDVRRFIKFGFDARD